MGRRTSRALVTAAAAAALVVGAVGPATAAPNPKNKDVVTVFCPDGAGGFVGLDVIATGALGFIVDAPADDKIFLRSLDLAAFDPGGTLVFEFHKTYGKRAGHGEPLSCSGSFSSPDGITTFFDALITRPRG